MPRLAEPREPSSGEAPRLDRFAVAAALREIGVLLALDGANRFRARAYERGAQAVESLTGTSPP
jgi:DNA polymerase/3'-5' exonuclease PolX